MVTFKEYINEAKGIISDLTGATKDSARAANKFKFFTIREWTEEEKNDTSYAWDIKQGKYKWDIVDNIKPDFKTSFPIEMMRIYEDDFKTPAINIKWALKDIAKGIWKPSKYAIEDLGSKYGIK